MGRPLRENAAPALLPAPRQKIKGLSRGEHVKALLLLALARRPRLLVLDELTSGLEPVARHEVTAEQMDVLKDDGRSILCSSHNTLEVEQISDHIAFIDRGRIVDSNDKETFVDGGGGRASTCRAMSIRVRGREEARV
jgi:ABC-2 type transport system ATP-binding protein